ncbi:SMA2 [Candida oxycetoniae]|uniref:SMA2 n=1 Tax=Candida oxycetoniae TaxID=497107 RepID=A0AAI9STR0_9ASCO|nr:SMA2 [Candida oxycetoniae]KAI3402643.1 SMA2 [Candida oxycetoniae]
MNISDYEKKQQDLQLRAKRHWKSYFLWSLVELTILIFLFLTTYFFQISCTTLIPHGPSLLTIKIRAQSVLAKNTIDLIQQGLKFATYLSNDLNIHANFTTNDSILQRLDTLYDGSIYHFNTFGYCRVEPGNNNSNDNDDDDGGGGGGSSSVECSNGEGLNVVSCFLQDLGMQLSRLTGDDTTSVELEGKFLRIYYDLIKQLCSGRMLTLSFPCVLQTYNYLGFILQYVVVLAILSLGVGSVVCLVDLVLLFGLFRTSLKFVFTIRMTCVLVGGICMNLNCVLVYYLSQFIENLINQYQVGMLSFNYSIWIIWNGVFLLSLVMMMKRYRTYYQQKLIY